MFRPLALAAAMMAAPFATWAQDTAPITPRSAVADLDSLKKTVEIPEFRIGGSYDLSDPASWENGAPDGVTLESLGASPMKVSYIDMGTPEFNEDGEIINAIVISSYYSGDSTSNYYTFVEGQGGTDFAGGPLIGPGLGFDTDRFYIVMFDALGLWGASKPSDGLGLEFPDYTYYDMVQANYRALVDHLNVANVVLATGVSMGGTQSYYWGLMHPEMVQAVIPVGGATATDGDAPVSAWTFQLAKAGLESDPIWQETGGDYYDLPVDQHPRQGPAYHWSVLNLTGYDLSYRQAQGWDTVKGLVFAWEPDQEGLGDTVMAQGAVYDAVDLKYRVEVGERHNINDLLSEYPTRALVMHVENDQWLISDKTVEAVQQMPGAQLIMASSPIAHYAVFQAQEMARFPMVNTFLREIGIVETPGKVCDAPDYTSPRVNMNPDPDTSFWLDNMTHPFPPQFTNVTDENGVEWEIGYFDVVCEGIENPETLVVVHGKGAFASHYGYLIKYAVEQGLRVVALDMPHAGLSGPGNLGKPFARTFEDMRSAFHGVIVDQLGIEEAYYHGHSLGGQFVLGYALKYPEAVKGLILEGPAGLEIFPNDVEADGETLRICDPGIAHDFEAWEAAWGPTGAMESEMSRDEQSVRDFFYFKQRDPETGAVSDSAFGYFKNDTEYARLHTDQRIAMISGNPDELEQWVTWFIYDIWTICNENSDALEEPLLSRLPQIEAPIFLAFGAEEPFIPSTSLNGLQDMAFEVINPFVASMEEAGREVVTKVYPGVGHFIHTDVPFEFARDTVDFVKTGDVELVTPDVVDMLVNRFASSITPGAGAPDRPSRGCKAIRVLEVMRGGGTIMTTMTAFRRVTAGAALALALPLAAQAQMLSESAGSGPVDTFTPQAAVDTLASLKKYYEIPEFRIGGAYDLDADPETWRNGGEGGTTLESLGMGPLTVGYIDVGTPEFNEAGEITNAVIISTYYSGDSTNMYAFWYPGTGNALCRGSGSGSRPRDRHRPVLRCVLGRAWALGHVKALGRLGPQLPAIQLLRHRSGQLSAAARSSERRERPSRDGRLDGSDAVLGLGRHVYAVGVR